MKSVKLLVVMALSTLVPTSAFADDIPETFKTDTSGSLPAGLTFKAVTGKDSGTVLRVVTWNEGSGARTAVFASTEKEGQKDGATWWSKTLYVTVFSGGDGKYKKVQDIIEAVQPCQLDMTARFIDASIGLTNIDGDAEGELTFAYVTRCAGDVSPMSMKLLMLEGKDKHALRGQTRLDVGQGEFVGGDYRADFKKKAPPALLEYAKNIWQTHMNTLP